MSVEATVMFRAPAVSFEENVVLKFAAKPSPGDTIAMDGDTLPHELWVVLWVEHYFHQRVADGLEVFAVPARMEADGTVVRADLP